MPKPLKHRSLAQHLRKMAGHAIPREIVQASETLTETAKQLRKERLTFMEAMAFRLLLKAATGDDKATALVFERLEGKSATAPQQDQEKRAIDEAITDAARNHLNAILGSDEAKDDAARPVAGAVLEVPGNGAGDSKDAGGESPVAAPAQ